MGSAVNPLWWVTLIEVVFIGLPIAYIVIGSVAGLFDSPRRGRRDNMHSAAYHAKHSHHGGHH